MRSALDRIAVISVAVMALAACCGADPDAMQAVLRAFQAHKEHMPAVRCTLLIDTVRSQDYLRMIDQVGTATASSRTDEWAASGGMYLTRRDELLPIAGKPGKFVSRKVQEGFDGKQAYTLRLDPNNPRNAYLTIVRNQMGSLDPLTLGYMDNRKWYADVLRARPFHLTGQVSDPKHGPLLVIEGEGAGGAQCRLYVAPRYDYLVVKSESTTVTRLPARHDRLVSETTEVTRVGSAWLTTAGRHTWDGTYRGRIVRLTSTTLRTRGLTTAGVSDATFQLPTLAPKSTIKDDVRGRVFVVQRDGSLKDVGPVGWSHYTPGELLQTALLYPRACVLVVLAGLTVGFVLLARDMRRRRRGAGTSP